MKWLPQRTGPRVALLGVLAALVIGVAIAGTPTDKFPVNGQATWCWDSTNNVWIGCPPPTGSSGAPTSVTIADGADVALGTTTDATYTSGAGTAIAILKGIFAKLTGVITFTASGSSSGIHDCSFTIGTPGTAQRIITAAQLQHGFLLEVGVNDSNADPGYFSNAITNPGAGVAGSLSLNPSTATGAGGSFVSPLNYPVGTDVYFNFVGAGDKAKCQYW